MPTILIVLRLLCLLSGLAALWLVMRYNLHMFQLNGYKNDEFRRWLWKNRGKQASLYILSGASLLATQVQHIVPLLILLLAELIVWRYYAYLKKSRVKKKLVFTKRVQRQIATNVILLAALSAGVLFYGKGYRYLPSLFALYVFLQPVLMMVVNLLNRPIEFAVNQHFINDAKRRLAAMPNLTMIGVTGSYGKTSIKYYLQTLLQQGFEVLITPESYNTPMGVVITVRQHLKPSHQIFICEMGARHVGDIKEICDIVHPQHGVITSIGPQHLETFFNMENIVSTKFELADALPPGGMLFVNGDNSYITEHCSKYPNVIRYSADGQGDYRAEQIALSPYGTEFTVAAPDGTSARFQLRLVGAHHIINVLGAIAVAHRLGLSLDSLRVPVRKIQPVAHRMQLIPRGKVTIIDDAYNSNPVGSKAAVETLALFDGLHILITPGMVELGAEEDEYNYKFGTYAAACCDYILLVGQAHTAPIYRGASEGGFDEQRLQVFEKLEDALAFAYGIKSEQQKYILLENDLPDQY